MADLQENKYKFDSGSPIGCGLAIVVFIFAIISLNAEMFTNMSNWDLRNYSDGTKYKDTIPFLVSSIF